MGYTLYWRRLPRLDAASFKAASVDFKVICEEIEKMGVHLAGPSGYGPAQAGPDRIAFNGLAKCGHPHRNLGHAYPADDAEGIELIQSPIVGPHYAGAKLRARSCGGECHAEPFVIDRMHDAAEWEVKTDDGMYRQHCTTEYKPYDLAVAAALVRLKHNLGEQIRVDSDDGQITHFREAMALCRRLFEKNSPFELEPEGKMPVHVMEG
jgi:hypothetical protein